MTAFLYAAARTAVQAGWGWLVAHFTILGVVPQDTAVNFVLTTVLIGGAAGLLRWLETRQGDGFWAKAARGVARVAMLGLSGKQPVYVAAGQNVQVVGPNGEPPK